MGLAGIDDLKRLADYEAVIKLNAISFIDATARIKPGVGGMARRRTEKFLNFAFCVADLDCILIEIHKRGFDPSLQRLAHSM